MPRKVDKKKKAESIGQAALKVFHRIGYHRTRMADIAVAANVGKGTLYEYFKDKLAILDYVFKQYFEAFEEGALKAMARVEGPGERLLALIDFALHHISEWQEHCAVFVDYFGLSRTGEDRLSSITEIYDRMLSLLEILIRECQASGVINSEIDPITSAELLVSIFDGIVLHGVFIERRCETHALATAALKVITEGLVENPQKQLVSGRV